jgi:hypothetical protein
MTEKFEVEGMVLELDLLFDWVKYEANTVPGNGPEFKALLEESLGHLICAKAALVKAVGEHQWP